MALTHILDEVELLDFIDVIIADNSTENNILRRQKVERVTHTQITSVSQRSDFASVQIKYPSSLPWPESAVVQD